jgi:hypothetical protein
MSIWRIASHVAALLLVGAASAFGQEPGMICGTTTDSGGTVLAGVTVTLARGSETPAQATTDSAGKYLFANVSVGTYRLSFELDGFKKTVRANVVITPGFERRIDQGLERGLPLPTDPPTAPVVFTKKTVTKSGTNTVPPPHLCTAPR